VSRHTSLRIDRKPLGRPSVNGEQAKIAGCHRLQGQRHAELLDHVRLVGEVEVHLDGGGAVHHVEAAPADHRHVARHHLVALLGHARRLVLRPVGREADAEKADAHGRADVEALAQMIVRLGADLVHGPERVARQLELAARLQRDGTARLRRRGA
jgi:hypothetical protein